MGHWGVGISSNDVFEDVCSHFFELYDEGLDAKLITKKLVLHYHDLIDSDESCNNFWFAIAKCQWQCKSLEDSILNKVRDIVLSKSDLKLWKELGVTSSELSKREKVLDGFLEKISQEKKAPKKRKVKKYLNAIFEKGDCLTFQLDDGFYYGIFVLESEKLTELGLNLIAAIDFQKSEKPTIGDFENALVLFYAQKLSSTEFECTEYVNWYYAQFFQRTTLNFEKVGQLTVEKEFSSSKDYIRVDAWENFKLTQDLFDKKSQDKCSDFPIIKLTDLRLHNGFKGSFRTLIKSVKNYFSN